MGIPPGPNSYDARDSTATAICVSVSQARSPPGLACHERSRQLCLKGPLVRDRRCGFFSNTSPHQIDPCTTAHQLLHFTSPSHHLCIPSHARRDAAWRNEHERTSRGAERGYKDASVLGTRPRHLACSPVHLCRQLEQSQTRAPVSQ